MRLSVLLWLLLLATACHQAQVVPTHSTGWHRCPGRETGCGEWELCSRDRCAFWGDPNGPGAGDGDKEGSFPGYVPH